MTEPTMKDDGVKRSGLRKLATRGLAGGFAAGAFAALAFGSVAGAQTISGFNSNQPVNYAADRIELQDRQNRVVLSGDVVITQGDLRLTAARTTVAYTDAGSLRIQRMSELSHRQGHERHRDGIAGYARATGERPPEDAERHHGHQSGIDAQIRQ